MIARFKKALRMLTPLEMATQELAEAELELLEAHTGVEYARALVTFNQERVARLKEYIATSTV